MGFDCYFCCLFRFGSIIRTDRNLTFFSAPKIGENLQKVFVSITLGRNTYLNHVKTYTSYLILKLMFDTSYTKPKMTPHHIFDFKNIKLTTSRIHSNYIPNKKESFFVLLPFPLTTLSLFTERKKKKIISYSSHRYIYNTEIYIDLTRTNTIHYTPHTSYKT